MESIIYRCNLRKLKPFSVNPPRSGIDLTFSGEPMNNRRNNLRLGKAFKQLKRHLPKQVASQKKNLPIDKILNSLLESRQKDIDSIKEIVESRQKDIDSIKEIVESLQKDIDSIKKMLGQLISSQPSKPNTEHSSKKPMGQMSESSIMKPYSEKPSTPKVTPKQESPGKAVTEAYQKFLLEGTKNLPVSFINAELDLGGSSRDELSGKVILGFKKLSSGPGVFIIFFQNTESGWLFPNARRGFTAAMGRVFPELFPESYDRLRTSVQPLQVFSTDGEFWEAKR